MTFQRKITPCGKIIEETGETFDAWVTDVSTTVDDYKTNEIFIAKSTILKSVFPSNLAFRERRNVFFASQTL